MEDTKRQYRKSFTMQEVADLLGVKIRFVRKQVRLKRLRVQRYSHNCVRISADEFDSYVRRNTI